MEKRPAELSPITNRPKTRVVPKEYNDPGWNVLRPVIDSDFATTPIGERAMTAMPSAPQDLLSFAQWAFGPTGLPDLKVLAYGDFSFKGRYAWQNWLFCRSQFGIEHAERCGSGRSTRLRELTFREITKSDWELQELIDGYSEMLEACPEDMIMHTY